MALFTRPHTIFLKLIAREDTRLIKAWARTKKYVDMIFGNGGFNVKLKIGVIKAEKTVEW